jgi:actin related protein 2/3 complex, subunit 5
MSIIQQHTSASLTDAWRTINIDALTEDSSLNFDTSSLHPPLPETTEAEARQLATQVRSLLRGGDTEGALRGCLESPVYNGNDLAKVGCTASSVLSELVAHTWAATAAAGLRAH